jgi:hypothetical protein
VLRVLVVDRVHEIVRIEQVMMLLLLLLQVQEVLLLLH